MSLIFLAAPLTGYLEEGGGLARGLRDDLSGLLERLRGDDYDVFSAHERESWGERLDLPSYALKDDLDKLKACDLLVAILGHPPSPGVQMELGAAVAYCKPILALSQGSDPVPYLVRGLSAVADAEVVQYNGIADVPAIVREFMTRRGLR